MSSEDGRNRAPDHILCLLLWAGIFAYLAAMPRNLATADESYFLVEAKRLAHGEILYKDVYYWSTPLADWIMALAFRIFGDSINTARLFMAALHATTGVLTYLASRRLGVRPLIALCFPVAYLALCQATWPYASPHWFATALMALLMVVLSGSRWIDRPASATVAGIVTGGLISVQHQKGIVVVAGVGLLLVLKSALGRRFEGKSSLRELMRQLLRFCAGNCIVGIPVLLCIVATGGGGPFFEQMIWSATRGAVNYRALVSTGYGDIGPFNGANASHTFPVLLKYLPVVIVPAIVRAFRVWMRRSSRAEFDQLVMLIVLGATSVLSVAYYPDFIHLAFAAQVSLVLWSETVETVARRIDAAGARSGLWIGLVVTGLAGGLSLHLYGNLARTWKEYPFPFQTAFGRVDFASQTEIQLVERIRSLLQQAGAHEFFAYPMHTALYLTTGANNPTPYQFLLPSFHPPQHVTNTLAILKAKRLPYLYLGALFLQNDDPVREYILRNYECADRSQPLCTLFRRRNDAPDD